MNLKTLILPVLALLNVICQMIFGVKLTEDELGETANQIVNAVSILLVIYGVVKNHFPTKNKPDDKGE
jgi:uncharacterized membrane protein